MDNYTEIPFPSDDGLPASWEQTGVLPGTSIPIYDAPMLDDRPGPNSDPVLFDAELVVSRIVGTVAATAIREDPTWRAVRAQVDVDEQATVLADAIKIMSTVRDRGLAERQRNFDHVGNAYSRRFDHRIYQEFAAILAALKAAFGVDLDNVDQRYMQILDDALNGEIGNMDQAADDYFEEGENV